MLLVLIARALACHAFVLFGVGVLFMLIAGTGTCLAFFFCLTMRMLFMLVTRTLASHTFVRIFHGFKFYLAKIINPDLYLFIKLCLWMSGYP